MPPPGSDRRVFVSWAFSTPFIVSTDRVLNNEVIVRRNFPKHPLIYRVVKLIVPEGLVTLHGDEWRTHRRLADRVLGTGNLTRMLPEMRSATVEMADELRKRVAAAGGQQQVSMMDVFRGATLDILTRSVFGINFGAMRTPQSPLNAALSSILKFPSSVIADTRFLFNPVNALRFYRNRRTLRKVVLDVIAYRRAQRAGASSGRFEALGDRLRRERLLHTLPNGCLDFVELLDEAQVPDQKIADEVFTFIVAGHETTMTQLTWAVAWMLRSDARIAERVRREADEVLGGLAPAEVTAEHVARLKYTGAVLREVLRIQSIIDGAFREVPEDCEINGVRLPKGACVVCMFAATARDGDVFDDPLQFRPERFVDEAGDEAAAAAFTPFSAGPRSCVGRKFAEWEARLILAELVRSFDMELQANQCMDVAPALTLGPRDPILVTLRERRK